MSKFNPYEVLDVSKTDDISTIEKKFKKLAVKYHPDKNKDPEAVKIYENMSKAKDILTNPEKKLRYDKYGITDENDREYQEQMQQEMMIKQKLREIMKITVSINDVLISMLIGKKWDIQRTQRIKIFHFRKKMLKII